MALPHSLPGTCPECGSAGTIKLRGWSGTAGFYTGKVKTLKAGYGEAGTDPGYIKDNRSGPGVSTQNGSIFMECSRTACKFKARSVCSAGTWKTTLERLDHNERWLSS